MNRQLIPFTMYPRFHSHSRSRREKPRHRYQAPPLMHSAFDSRSHRMHRRKYQVEPFELMYPRIEKEMLELHNHYRSLHCAPPLRINPELNQIAQSYAEHLAATSTFEHSGNKWGSESLGENLYMMWRSPPPVEANAKAAMKSWYEEIRMHNFQRPTFSHETGHFTQLVWKGSRELGVGVAISPNGQEVYMVTNYFPAGNMIGPGSFEQNVLPLGCGLGLGSGDNHRSRRRRHRHRRAIKY